MTNTEIKELIQELGVPNIKFGVTDIDGVLRGKLISTQKFLKALDEHIGFCNVIFGWDVADQCYDNGKISGWHNGYPDAFATIDAGSFRQIPWDDKKPFFLADFSESQQAKAACPRTLLKHVDSLAREMGFIPKFAAEFEWFNFRETPHSLHEKNYQNPTPITPGMFGYSILRTSQNVDFVNQLWDDLLAFNIPLEGLHTETGDGVYEAAIAYDDVLLTADRAALFKTSVKEIAYKHEMMASFMAKWNPQLPGCSGHLHQSLWDKQDKNLFYDESTPTKMSAIMESYLAGILHCMPYIIPFFAPTTNSYRRYVEGSWAPTSIGWGIENRTTPVRIITNSKSSTRIENRVPGADANPYLSMAASLAAGLFGIKNKMKLELPATVGNQYEVENAESLPENLGEAIKKMKSSTIPTLLFGEEFVDHFTRTREWEWSQFEFDDDVENWELKRYFEII